MILMLATFAGFLYAGGLYMMMRRSMGKLLVGLVLLSHGSNLLIFISGNVDRARPPLVSANAAAGAVADPVPQALVLTAIVISFGVLAFALALVRRAYEVLGTDDLEHMRRAEP